MSDIKTAMSAALFRAPTHVQKIINQWDDEGEKHFPINNPIPVQTKPAKPAKPAKRNAGAKISNNVMRATFEFIQQYPGLTSKQICEQMEHRGFKPTSVVSVVSQLHRSGQLHKDGVTYRTINAEYKPMGATANAKVNKLKKQVEALKKQAKSQGISALPVTPAVGIATLQPVTQGSVDREPKKFAEEVSQPAFDPKKIVNPLTVYQARMLYDELEAMFGGGYGRHS